MLAKVFPFTLSRAQDLQALTEVERACIEEYVSRKNSDWDWQLSAKHPLLACIRRSRKKLQKLLDKYRYTRQNLGMCLASGFCANILSHSALTPLIMSEPDMRLRPPSAPRKPSAAVAAAMQQHKRQRATAEERAAFAFPPANAVPAPVKEVAAAVPQVPEPVAMNPDVLFHGPRAIFVNPAIAAWMTRDYQFVVAAPIFHYAIGPHVEICDDRVSVSVEWTWAAMSTKVVNVEQEQQLSFDALEHWGVAADRLDTPKSGLTRVVPVPMPGVRLRYRTNELIRKDDASCCYAVFCTTLSPDPWKDKLDPPNPKSLRKRRTLVRCLLSTTTNS